jgi:hypothetical protein
MQVRLSRVALEKHEKLAAAPGDRHLGRRRNRVWWGDYNRAASALKHANISITHDVGEPDARPYIVMQYLEGSDA